MRCDGTLVVNEFPRTVAFDPGVVRSRDTAGCRPSPFEESPPGPVGVPHPGSRSG